MMQIPIQADSTNPDKQQNPPAKAEGFSLLARSAGLEPTTF